MVFCGNCGKRASDEEKFCTNCGTPIKETTIQVTKEVGEIIKEEYRSGQDYTELSIQKTTRELGSNLEETVAKILQDRGYQTQLRNRMTGKSGQHNEIDILAKRNNTVLAVECKNYAEGMKVGIKEMRDFTAKLDDLELKNGLFVTTTEFSSDARGWADNNPNEVDLWDGSELKEKILTLTLGRTNSQIVKIENSLQPKGNFEDYSILLLKNKENVGIKYAELVFHPFYIVSFILREEFRTPDKQIHTQHNSGKYFVDGLSGKILYCIDDKGHSSFDLQEEEKQIVRDLEEIEPQRLVEVIQGNNYRISKPEPSIFPKEVNFKVQTQVIDDNKAIIQYDVRLPRNEIETRDYTHVPDRKGIQTQSKVVYVPKWEIEFESKEYTYTRIILPASDTFVIDEIAKCKHLLRKKTTFAVCEVCGIAKCEDDIIQDNTGICYCKKHVPDTLKEAHKGSKLSEKLSRFRFRK